MSRTSHMQITHSDPPSSVSSSDVGYDIKIKLDIFVNLDHDLDFSNIYGNKEYQSKLQFIIYLSVKILVLYAIDFLQ